MIIKTSDGNIIIDGVEVSKCPHLIEDYQWWNIAGQEEHDINRCALSFDEYTDFEEDDFCKNNPNCYYKRLKRKEQECEKLKDELINVKWKIEAQDIELNDKEEQLDQLKKELDITSCANIELSLEVKKFEKAIEEIEEIADNNYENPEMKRIFNIIGGLDV